jgi:uncharacterized damage-inducible protein DinB
MSSSKIETISSVSGRRSFLGGTAALFAAGLSGILPAPSVAAADAPGLNILGPRPGYSPQVGTFVSMLAWLREANGVLSATKGLTQADLDVLFDANANTIGALMLHLAATEVYYGMNTFDGMKWGTWSDAIKQKWDAAMNLGDAGRKTIKGRERDYYVEILNEVRGKTLAEFKKRDDKWLLTEINDPDWGPCNNLAKWFHVCEHEAHHTGQIALLRKRIPGAKPDAG